MWQSIQKNKKGILLMCISSVLVCVGQLMWKLATDGNIVLLLIGFGLYGLGALVMIYAYRFGSLSVLQPVLSLNYVFTILLSHFVLKEMITLSKVIGVLIIIIGVLLIAGGDE